MPSRCYHCDSVGEHDPACIVAVVKRGGSVFPFVAVKLAVMRGSEHIAVAVSHTMAKRISNALNNHTPNKRGE